MSLFMSTAVIVLRTFMIPTFYIPVVLTKFLNKLKELFHLHWFAIVTSDQKLSNHVESRPVCFGPSGKLCPDYNQLSGLHETNLFERKFSINMSRRRWFWCVGRISCLYSRRTSSIKFVPMYPLPTSITLCKVLFGCVFTNPLKHVRSSCLM